MAVTRAGAVGYPSAGGLLKIEPSRYTSDAASDKIFAGDGPNKLYGNSGNDKLYGRGGHDLLAGGDGRDLLHGGKGADYFVFDQVPGRKNVDRLMDFSRKQGDKIALSHKSFKAVELEFEHDSLGSAVKDRMLDLPVGRMAESAFRLGAVAKLETDRIVYNKAAGALYYDKDGSGPEAAMKIADFKPGTTLAATDFLFF